MKGEPEIQGMGRVGMNPILSPGRYPGDPILPNRNSSGTFTGFGMGHLCLPCPALNPPLRGLGNHSLEVWEALGFTSGVPVPETSERSGIPLPASLKSWGILGFTSWNQQENLDPTMPQNSCSRERLWEGFSSPRPGFH